MRRLGVGIPKDSDHDPQRSLALLGGVTDDLAWYNWACDGPSTGRYYPMVWRHFDADVRARMAAHPHEIWLVGNEPERAEQTNKHYSYVAWDVGEALRLGVQVVAPNVHWVDSLYVRGYCQQFVWSVGVDQMKRLRAFGVHLYERTTLEFDMALHQVRKFLDGMGLRRLPIWVTECDATPGVRQMGQATLLRHVYRRLHEPTTIEKTDLFERAFWFSANYSRRVANEWVIPQSNLLSDGGDQLTALGREFRRLQQDEHLDRSADTQP